MRARDLIAGEGELWQAATHHPFLDQVRDGSLEAAGDRALARAGDPEREAFRWIARYGRNFWQTAYSGADG